MKKAKKRKGSMMKLMTAAEEISLSEKQNTDEDIGCIEVEEDHIVEGDMAYGGNVISIEKLF